LQSLRFEEAMTPPKLAPMAHRDAVRAAHDALDEYWKAETYVPEESEAMFRKAHAAIDSINVGGHARNCICHPTILSRFAHDPNRCAHCSKLEGEHPFTDPRCW
jgi:hypothetical protein